MTKAISVAVRLTRSDRRTIPMSSESSPAISANAWAKAWPISLMRACYHGQDAGARSGFFPYSIGVGSHRQEPVPFDGPGEAPHPARQFAPEPRMTDTLARVEQPVPTA